MVELAAQNDAEPRNDGGGVDHPNAERPQVLEENTAVAVAAQNDAEPRNDYGGVDHPTAERSPSPLQRTVATQFPDNNLNDDTEEGQRSAIETLYYSTAAEIPSGTRQLLVQESLEEAFPWSKHLPASLDITLTQDWAHQNNACQSFSSIAIRGPAEHPNLFTMPSERNGHPPSLSRRDPVTPNRPRRSYDIPPAVDSATSYHSSRACRHLSEQASQIDELQGREIMVRGQRHIQNFGPASVGAYSSRAPEAHLEDPLGHKTVVRYSTPVGASSSRASTAPWDQNRPNRLIEDPQGYENPDRRSVVAIPVLTRTNNGHVTWELVLPSEPLMSTRRTDPRPHTLPLTDEGTDEGAMVSRQHNFHENVEAVGERSLDSPSPQPRRRSPENIKPHVSDWVQALNPSGSQGLATETPHNVDHASISVSNPDLTPPSAANPSQESSSTANALPRHNQAALRRSYKQDLLDTTRAWPGPPREAHIRFLIKFDDKDDDYRQFTVPEQKMHTDWRNYEIYARKKRPRDPDLPCPVYGNPLFRDLDILKLWVNSNWHILMRRTWPPGYIPQHPDANEGDIGDEMSSVCSVDTEDQFSVASE